MKGGLDLIQEALAPYRVNFLLLVCGRIQFIQGRSRVGRWLIVCRALDQEEENKGSKPSSALNGYRTLGQSPPFPGPQFPPPKNHGMPGLSLLITLVEGESAFCTRVDQ
jgi:hypothetical protein